MHTRPTKLAKQQPERLAQRRAALSCNAFAIVHFLIKSIIVQTLPSNDRPSEKFHRPVDAILR